MTSREQTIADIVQQVQNQIEETLLFHAPEHWQDHRLGAIEDQVLDHTRLVLNGLKTDELQAPGVLDGHIAQAVGEVKRLIHEHRQSRTFVERILEQLARSTLLPDELSKDILAGDSPQLAEIIYQLAVTGLDAYALTAGDPSSSVTQRRLAHQLLVTMLMLALSTTA